MAAPPIERLKMELDDACTFLKAFTLGKRGFTQRDGAAGVRRVSEASARLKAGLPTGAVGQEITAVLAAAQGCIEAAQARLALLNAAS